MFMGILEKGSETFSVGKTEILSVAFDVVLHAHELTSSKTHDKGWDEQDCK